MPQLIKIGYIFSHCTSKSDIQNHTFDIIKCFKISRKLNEKSLRLKNFRRFHGFALHYESTESVESWEDFVLLSDKKAGLLFNGVETNF